MSFSRPLSTSSASPQDTKWARRRDIPIALLAWTVLIALVIWGAGHIVRTLLVLILSALLSYALAPIVRLLQRVMPRPLAILSTYLIAFIALALLIYLIVDTSIQQVRSLADFLTRILTPSTPGQLNPLEQTIASFGVSHSQLLQARDQLIARTDNLATNVLPLVTSTLDFVLDVVVVAVISIYLLIDGARIAQWCRSSLPQTVHANFLLDTLQRVVGGYIRGQVLLSVLIGVLVGGGLALFHVPYALLLGVMAFILEFIPILGTLVSGAICTLIALTQGWLIALFVLIYFIIVHVLEGDIIGPRIVGKAVGLHPVVSLAAVITGAELFGVVGALLASPIAGVLQSLLIAFWYRWRETHPEQFADARIEGEAHEASKPPLADQAGHI